jgi:hypothetical protein
LDVDGESILDCRSGIGRGDGSIILIIDSNPTLLLLFYFFVLRTAEWRRTVSLWLRTFFRYLEADVRRREGMRSCVKGQVELTNFGRAQPLFLQVEIFF